MKQIARLVGGVLLLLGVSAAQAAIISVDTIPGGSVDGARTVDSGDSFDVDVVVEDVTDFAGFQFDLGFDSAVLTATGITSGGIFDPFTFEISSVIGADSVTFAEVSLGFPGLDITGPAVLATISFHAIGAGNSGLPFSNVILSDAFSTAITPVTENSGDITVTGAVPLPGTQALLAIGFVGVRISRKKESMES